MRDGFVARLDRLPRLWRIALCGLVVLMALPLLSNLFDVVPAVVIALGLYMVGWFFWIGFGAALPQVRAGAMLFLLVGVMALAVWVVYTVTLLVLLALPE